jgi:hypothetical protein
MLSSSQSLVTVAEKLYGSKKIRALTPESSETALWKEGEKTLRNKAIQYLHQSIEGCHNSMAVISTNMDKLADSSKQRNKLRKKITKEKTTLKELTALLSSISDQAFSPDDVIEKGLFYWRHDELGEVPIRTKRLVIDKYMELERFEEELKQLKREMVSYMRYYTNIMLTQLRLQLTEIEETISSSPKELHENESIESHALQDLSDNKNRYMTNSMDIAVLEGKKALIMEGINFAMSQIEAGLQAFSTILQIDMEQFKEATSSQEDINISESENDNEDSDDEDVEDESSVGYDVNCVLHDLAKVKIDPVCEVSAESLTDGVYFWQFPNTISQGGYKGRNGSNACSIISLVLGFTINKEKLSIPICTYRSILSSEFMKAICGSIEFGNHVYDVCRASLPSRYLSIGEAATALCPWVTDFSLQQPLPVRLHDDYELSTVYGQLKQAGDNFTASIIINEKTSLFHHKDGFIMYVDTHRHNTKGMIIIAAHQSHLKDFVDAVWSVEGHSHTAFGNMVFIKY